jgi:hypothetical protein
MAKNKFSPIKHLVINNKISLYQLDSLFSYVPQLCHLSFGHLVLEYRSRRTHNPSITLHSLIDVSLDLNYISFNKFEQLVIDFFSQVQILRIGRGCASFLLVLYGISQC